MLIDPIRISKIFGTTVLSAETILSSPPNREDQHLFSKGLRLHFPQNTNLKFGRFLRPFFLMGRGHELCSLVREHGFVVVEGASLDAPSTAILSGFFNQEAALRQDFFHADVFLIGPETSITLLMNKGKSRFAPTLYSNASSVRRALHRFKEEEQLSEEEKESFNLMLNPFFSFSLYGEARIMKEKIEKKFPDLTQRIWSLIPPQEIHVQQWQANKTGIVFHSNMSGRLLHARPPSSDLHNSLAGVDIYPF